MRRTISAVILLSVFVAVLVGAGPASGQAASSGKPKSGQYSIIDLGEGQANDINCRGQVVGVNLRSAYAVIWEKGKVTDIAWGQAFALNNHGQVVGKYWPNYFCERAFLWKEGQLMDISEGWGCSSANDINNRGQVVGVDNFEFETPSGYVEAYEAFLWEKGDKTYLGTLAGGNDTRGYYTSSASGINNLEQVVGSSDTASGERHAFLWRNGHMTDLGTLGGPDSRATAINNRGQVVGSSTTASGETHAFFWENGEMTDLGTLDGGDDSSANDINNRGQVVGSSNGRAVIWERGKVTDLGSLDAAGSSSANAINNSGQVVGESGGQAVLWDK